MMDITIRVFEERNWEQVKSIYEAGIATGNATFETSTPTYEKWVSSVIPHSHLVAEADGIILGWCKLTKVSERCVYAGVGEVSVYVDPGVHGKGVGSKLMTELIKKSEEVGIWTINASIFPENVSSLALQKNSNLDSVKSEEESGLEK